MRRRSQYFSIRELKCTRTRYEMLWRQVHIAARNACRHCCRWFLSVINSYRLLLFLTTPISRLLLFLVWLHSSFVKPMLEQKKFFLRSLFWYKHDVCVFGMETKWENWNRRHVHVFDLDFYSLSLTLFIIIKRKKNVVRI